ncbi:ImmA/IrrE family metallo-endopeptidase [Rhodopirellula baltica]
MARNGWIEKKSTWLGKYQELLQFFGTAKLDALNESVQLAPSFRKADGKKACPEALAAWLRKGLMDVQGLELGEFSKQRTIDGVESFRELTYRGVEGLTVELPAVAAAMGIGVVFVPHLKGTYVGGAAYWHGEIPVIQLSYRWKRHDILWFNFFHELGHIVLHSRYETYLDDFSEDVSEHERAANRFAAERLIPRKDWEEFVRVGKFNRHVIQRFSAQVKVAESIVVGRLHREERVPPTKLREFLIAVPV